MTQKRTDNVVMKNPSDRSNRKRQRSCINDAEIDSYLHSNKEMELKRMIWELLNKNEMKRRKLQKQPTKEEKKKNGSVKEGVKIGKNVEKKRELSSKINYDALKELMGDEECHLGNQKNAQVEVERECNEVGDCSESECNEVGDFDGGDYVYDSDYDEKY